MTVSNMIQLDKFLLWQTIHSDSWATSSGISACRYGIVHAQRGTLFFLYAFSHSCSSLDAPAAPIKAGFCHPGSCSP